MHATWSKTLRKLTVGCNMEAKLPFKAAWLFHTSLVSLFLPFLDQKGFFSFFQLIEIMSFVARMVTSPRAAQV